MENNCPKCNVPLVENANFCEKCGYQITSTATEKIDTKETGHLLVSRKKSFYGFAISLNVQINNVDYNLSSGDTIDLNLLPGKYLITYKVWCRRQKELTIDVLANQEYFLEFVNDYLWGGFKVSKNSKLN